MDLKLLTFEKAKSSKFTRDEDYYKFNKFLIKIDASSETTIENLMKDVSNIKNIALQTPGFWNKEKLNYLKNKKNPYLEEYNCVDFYCDNLGYEMTYEIYKWFKNNLEKVDLFLKRSNLKEHEKAFESKILSFKDFVNEREFIPNPNIDVSKKPYYFSQEDDVWENDENWKFEDRKSTGTKFCSVVRDKNHSWFSLYLDNKNKVGLEYYSGENYTVGSYARSHSRRFDVKDIPKAYQNQFKEMVKAFEYHFKINLSQYDSNITKYYDEIKKSLNFDL